jgi:spermidine synthase
VLGDARLTLAETSDQYDLIVLDAFSSDAIPIHLMTREAMATYVSKLAPGGRADGTNVLPAVKPVRPETYVPMIVEANKVRFLSPADAQVGYPVRLRGVVTSKLSPQTAHRVRQLMVRSPLRRRIPITR